MSGFKRIKYLKTITIFYYGIPVNIELTKGTDNDLELGKVLQRKNRSTVGSIFCVKTDWVGCFCFGEKYRSNLLPDSKWL